MFPEVEGALGIASCSRVVTKTQPNPVAGHSTPRKSLDGLFASLMWAAMGAFGSPPVFASGVPNGAREAPDGGAQVFLPVRGPQESSPLLAADSFAVSGETDGDLPWAVDQGGTGTGGFGALPVDRFLAQDGSVPHKTGFSSPDKLPLGAEYASVNPNARRLGVEPERVAHDLRRFAAQDSGVGVDGAVHVTGEEATPSQLQPDGSFLLARYLAREWEPEGNPSVTPDVEGAARPGEAARIAGEASRDGLTEAVASREDTVDGGRGDVPRVQSLEGTVLEEMEKEAGFPTRRTGGEPEKREPVEPGEVGFLRHPVQTTGSPGALLASEGGERPAQRKDVSLRDARALAEHLREEALKRLPRSVELRLDPPRLGNVTAVLTARGQDIAVRFVTESHEAFRAFQASAGELAKSFDELGLTLAGFTVDQGHPQGPSSWGERRSQIGVERRRTTRALQVEMVRNEAPAAPYLSALSGNHLDYIV